MLPPGRTFFLLDADVFTRNWYQQQLGQQLGPAGSYPADPVDAYREHFGLSGAPGGHCLSLRGWQESAQGGGVH
jgi:hypothetical protein